MTGEPRTTDQRRSLSTPIDSLPNLMRRLLRALFSHSLKLHGRTVRLLEEA
jgi:hypothetical protein